MHDSSIPPSSRSGHHSLVGTTLREHVLLGMRAAPGATGEFTSLLNHITLAIRIITSRVRSAGLADMLGYTGETNVQGEAVQKLDAYANEVLLAVLEKSGHPSLVASEEMEEPVYFDRGGKYAVLFDPLDGSSNIDTNVSIGTIFAIYRKKSSGPVDASDALRPGREIAAAGYALYGPSTVLVLTTGQGVHCFTLDPNVGEFFLSRAHIECPSRGATFSVNVGNSPNWTKETRAWCAHMQSNRPAEGLPYNHRYVGSLVADAHRTLMKGGIFAYPADSRSPNGKLRLLYEANPFAFIFEQAGGAAIDGEHRILDIVPRELHQRTALVLGSSEDVACYRAFHLGEKS